MSWKIAISTGTANFGSKRKRDVAADHQQREDQRLEGAVGHLFAEGRPDAGAVEAVRRRSRTRRRAPSAASLTSLGLQLAASGSGRRCRRSTGSETCWISSPLIPTASSASRTPSSSVGLTSATLIRVPDSKSMPKLSCLVASASAPTSRITPEIEKNQRLAPMKSKCQRTPLPRGAEGARRAQQPRAAHACRAAPG